MGKECPRITKDFLTGELKAMGPLLFGQEYEGEFIDGQSSAFAADMIERALVDHFEPFLPASRDSDARMAPHG